MSIKLLSLLTTVLLAVPSTPAVNAQTRPVQVALVTPVQIFPEGDAIAGIRLNILYGRNVSMMGLDLGLVNHTKAGGFKGVGFGFVGLCDGDFTGWQHSAVSITKGNIEGLQVGLFNSAGYVNGLQFGVVNTTGSMKGLQIGLVNIIERGGAFPIFPIVNWSL
jgi:hypothetical protein